MMKPHLSKTFEVFEALGWGTKESFRRVSCSRGSSRSILESDYDLLAYVLLGTRACMVFTNRTGTHAVHTNDEPLIGYIRNRVYEVPVDKAISYIQDAIGKGHPGWVSPSLSDDIDKADGECVGEVSFAVITITGRRYGVDVENLSSPDVVADVISQVRGLVDFTSSPVRLRVFRKFVGGKEVYRVMSSRHGYLKRINGSDVGSVLKVYQGALVQSDSDAEIRRKLSSKDCYSRGGVLWLWGVVMREGTLSDDVLKELSRSAICRSL